MAVSSGLLAAIVDTNARIQALATLHETAATAGGLVRTSDTGQTASNAFTAPGSTGRSSGYQIWRFDDALQATRPVFYRIEWGMSTTGSNSMGMWVTIGTGSDGAGNITGVLLARTAIGSAAIGTSTLLLHIASAGTSRLMLCYGIGYATQNNCVFFSFERSKDSSGNDTADGIIWHSTSAGGATWNAQYIPFTGTVRAAQSYLNCPFPGPTTTLANGQLVGFSPVLPFGIDGAKCAGLNFLVYVTGDAARANTITLNVYGSPHTYYLVGTPQGWAAAASLIAAASSIAIRYE